MKWINEEYELTDSNIYSAECSCCGCVAIAYGRVNYNYCPQCGKAAEKEEKEVKNDDGKSL